MAAVEPTSELANKIYAETGENVSACYQCVKCTSGCPLAEHFDLSPNQVMRAAQLGLEEVALGAATPWLCAGCQTCTTRCPNDIDVARVMDFMAAEAKARGIAAKTPEVALFNDIFLRNAKLMGRTYELALMAEFNLRSGQPLKDARLAVEMIRKGKMKFLPEFARPPYRAEPVEAKANGIAYYPGCSLHSVAAEYDRSVRAVATALDLELIEPKKWVCCGASPAHRSDARLAVSLPLTNLALIEQMGLNEVAMPCSACFGRHKAAQREAAHNPALKAEVETEIGHVAERQIAVTSFLDVMVDRIGLDAIGRRTSRPLAGLRIACYYGCLLTRPRTVSSHDPEYPMVMDRLMITLGADVVDWGDKTSCCGGSLALTQTEIALDLTRKILADARAAGADALALSCPMCHANLDGRQHQMTLSGQAGSAEIPVFYFTQLMALAFGLDEESTALAKNLVDPRPLLVAKRLLS